jgi:hypothetical protein
MRPLFYALIIGAGLLALAVTMKCGASDMDDCEELDRQWLLRLLREHHAEDRDDPY